MTDYIKVQSIIEWLYAFAVEYGLRVLASITLLILGLWFTGLITRLVIKGMQRSKLEASLVTFFSGLINFGLKILIFITVASTMGVATSSFLAVLGAAGLAIGLALQGSLSNFAGGVLILLFKPFKVGDVIEAQSFMGTVSQIGLIYTTIYTFQNQQITIPNGALANGTITNFSAAGIRRIDIPIALPYTADLAAAKEVLNEISLSDERILSDKEPFVGVTRLGDYGMELSLRVWCNNPDFLPLGAALREAICQRMAERGISIQLPARVLA